MYLIHHAVTVPSACRTTPDQFVGNPYLMNGALDKVDHAFGEVIAVLEQEERSQDRQSGGNALLHKFKSWRNELERMRTGVDNLSLPTRAADPPGITQEGGMFAD